MRSESGVARKGRILIPAGAAARAAASAAAWANWSVVRPEASLPEDRGEAAPGLRTPCHPVPGGAVVHLTTALPIPAQTSTRRRSAVRGRTGTGPVATHEPCEIRTPNPVYDSNIVT